MSEESKQLKDQAQREIAVFERQLETCRHGLGILQRLSVPGADAARFAELMAFIRHCEDYTILEIKRRRKAMKDGSPEVTTPELGTPEGATVMPTENTEATSAAVSQE